MKRSKLFLIFIFFFTASHSVMQLTGCTQQEIGPEKIKIQLNWFPDGEHAYLYYGKKLGFFRQIGIDLDIQGGRGSELSAKLLAANQVQVALASPEALLSTVAQGGKIRSLGILYDKTPVVIYSIKGNGITNLKSLYGKKLGVLLGSSTYVQYEGIAKLEKLDRNKIKEVPVDGRAGPEMLNRGDIDALMFFSQYVSGFEIRYNIKYDQITFEEILLANNLKLAGMVLACNERFLNQLGEGIAIKFKAAVIKSIIAANDHPDAAILALKEAVPDTEYEPELAKLNYVLKIIIPSGNINLILKENSFSWGLYNLTATKLGIIDSEDVWKKFNNIDQ